MKIHYFEPEIEQQKPSHSYHVFMWIGYGGLTTHENSLGSLIILAEDLDQARTYARQTDAIRYNADIYNNLPTIRFKLGAHQKACRPFVLVCPCDSAVKVYNIIQGETLFDRFNG